MTLQEIYEKSLFHVRKQGQPARSKGGLCQYRTPSGLACAIGGLFPDSAYNPDMDAVEEDTGISNLLHAAITDDDAYYSDEKEAGQLLSQALTDAGIQVNERDVRGLLQDLQSVHDAHLPGDEYMPHYEKAMQTLASTYGLVYKELTC